jgi:hypothetical protein
MTASRIDEVGVRREQRLHRRLVTGGGAHVDPARRAGLPRAVDDADVAEELLGSGLRVTVRLPTA